MEIASIDPLQYRLESDSMGNLQVPKEAMWSAQTQRALQNFPASGLMMPLELIHALGLIKQAAALANEQFGDLAPDLARAIQSASADVARGQVDEQFPLDVFQTGSGTSTNMNANEVIATLASRLLGRKVRPNDDVNKGQSSNDVIPTAIHVAASLAVRQRLLPALAHLADVIGRRSVEFAGVVKTGRTHLMDAMPVTLGQELSGWKAQIDAGGERLRSVLPRLQALAQGGTAVGTGINARVEFSGAFAAHLSRLTGLDFRPSSNFFEALSSQDTAVELSGQLKVLAVSMMKISNDLRWMNSGPLAGLGEITLRGLQPGSSIMPGKVNPVIPEAVAMMAAQVIGNDLAITVGGQSGNFQLNVMLPLIAYNLIQSLRLLTIAASNLADHALADFTVNARQMTHALERNPILITALNAIIGYEKGAQIAKVAYAQQRPILDVATELTPLVREELIRLLEPLSLTSGGIKEAGNSG